MARYQSEPEGLRYGPVWHYDWSAASFIAAVATGLAGRGRVRDA